MVPQQVKILIRQRILKATHFETAEGGQKLGAAEGSQKLIHNRSRRRRPEADSQLGAAEGGQKLGVVRRKADKLFTMNHYNSGSVSHYQVRAKTV